MLPVRVTYCMYIRVIDAGPAFCFVHDGVGLVRAAVRCGVVSLKEKWCGAVGCGKRRELHRKNKPYREKPWLLPLLLLKC